MRLYSQCASRLLAKVQGYRRRGAVYVPSIQNRVENLVVSMRRVVEFNIADR